MGCSSSQLRHVNNPLQDLQLKETKRARHKHKEKHERKQISKIKKQHGKSKKNKKKHSNRKNSGMLSSQADVLSANIDYSELNTDEYNCEISEKTRKQLDNDLCTFILNQILLTYEFFANYESEMVNISNELLMKEAEFNEQLEEHSILLGNPLDAAAAKWLTYKPIHGPEKNHAQPLQLQVMYIVFENIDISRPNDANYDSISPLCKVDLDTEFYKTTPCTNECMKMLQDIKWKGYTRLKFREEPQIQRNVKLAKGNLTRRLTEYNKNCGTSNVNKDADYDYVYITHLNTIHPLSELKMFDKNCEFDTKILPESCVSNLGNFIEVRDYMDSDDENHDSESDSDTSSITSRSQKVSKSHKDYETIQAVAFFKLEQERHRILLQQNYLNSKEFMRYFSELIQQTLIEKLPIPHTDLDESTYRGSSIYTKQYEIIPAIHVAQNAINWPDCTFQFRIRERPIFVNRLTGKQFQWPTKTMIKRIESFGFHVIPIGYAPKKYRNQFRELEWRIIFPKAERYLENQLSSTQAKVFMLTKALVKTFVEPHEKNKALMFTTDHLRMHLFWECERNFTAWPEEFLGEVLIQFISSFMKRLREKCLRDYFIEERNLFEIIPEYSLTRLYSIFADIIANPLMHVMLALRNLNLEESFFPKINFKAIFENLTENDILKLKMKAKNARNMTEFDKGDDATAAIVIDEGPKGLIGMEQHREKTRGKLRRKTTLMKYNIAEMKKQDELTKRISVESIDIEFFFNKNLCSTKSKFINQGLENLRRTNILEIFLDHLLAMAEKAASSSQVKFYLDQAKRLCSLYHSFGCDMKAKDYMAAIQNIEESSQDLHQNNDMCSTARPALPLRFSCEPINIAKFKDLIQPPELRKGNIYVEVHSRAEVHPTNDSIIIKRLSKNLSTECEEDSADKNVTSLVVRKSIKFNESSINLHNNETSSMTNVTQCNANESISDQNVTPSAVRKSIKFNESSINLRNTQKNSTSGVLESNENESISGESDEDLADQNLSGSVVRKSIKFNESSIMSGITEFNRSESHSDEYEKDLANQNATPSAIGKSIKFNERPINLYNTEMSSNSGLSEFNINESISDEYEKNQEDKTTTPSAVRKSIRFRESCTTLRNILTSSMSGAQKLDDNHQASDINIDNNQECNGIPAVSDGRLDNENCKKDKIDKKSLLEKLNKFGTSTGILKSTTINQNSNIMKTLTLTSEKIITTMSTEEKRKEIRNMLRKRSVQLKGTFNQSSDL